MKYARLRRPAGRPLIEERPEIFLLFYYARSNSVRRIAVFGPKVFNDITRGDRPSGRWFCIVANDSVPGCVQTLSMLTSLPKNQENEAPLRLPCSHSPLGSVGQNKNEFFSEPLRRHSTADEDFGVVKLRSHLSFALLLAIALVATKPVLANQDSHRPIRAGSTVELIVRRVEAGSAAAKAGLHERDVLRSWSAEGTAQTTFRSPFDLQLLEIETGQEKPVTFEGLQGNRKHVWNLEPGNWGIEIQPRLSPVQFSFQRELRELFKSKKLSDALARYASVGSHPDDPLPSWVTYWPLRDAVVPLESTRVENKVEDICQTATHLPQIPPTMAVQLFWSWASAYAKRGDPSRAEYCYMSALADSQRLGAENLLTAFTLNMLGNLAYHRGELDLAEQDYRQALSLEQHLAPASLSLAKSLNGLGNVAQVQGDLTKAEEYHLRGLDIRERLVPHGIDVASSLNNLGNVAESRGDLEKSEDYHRRALAIREKIIPGSMDHAASLLNLGAIAADRADLESAESFLRRALAIAQRLEPGGPAVAAIFNDLAFIAVDRDTLFEAAFYNRKALEIEEKLAPGGLDVAQSLHNLGDVAQRQGNLAEAEQYQGRALAIQDRLAPESLAAAATLENLASVARDQKNLPRAEEYYRKALAIRDRLAPNSKIQARNLAGLASVLRAEARLDESSKLFEQALEAFENQTAHLGGSDEAHFRFRAQHVKYYREYVDLLLDLRQPELALDVLERSRARTLLEMLSEAEIDIRNGVDPSLLQRERMIQRTIERASDRRIRLLSDKHTKDQLADLNGELDELIKQYQEVQAEIRFNSPKYAALMQPQPTNVKQIQQQLLDSDTLLLEYMLGDNRSYLWVVSQNSLATFQLPGRREIEDLSRRLFTSWTARSHAPQNESPLQRRMRLARADTDALRISAALSQMVLGPAKAALDRKRLLIVGDGALLYVPFPALPVPGREPGVPMVQHYEISSLPSASILSVLQDEEHNRARAPKSVIVLADPVFEESDPRVELARNKASSSIHSERHNSFSPSLASDRLLRSMNDIGLETDGTLHLQRLPFTRQEAEAILSATPPGQGLKALDFEATRALAASSGLARYKVVHFATHGVIDSENPQLSGLVFSMVDKQGRPQDGFLELQDIYNLSLPVDLVVLSACETGLGKQIDGEGLVGLTRGFMYAGASRVVASLWKVSDAATAKLMAYFYEAMEQRGMAPAAALRFAQMQMLKEKRWPAAYYWAAFQIQGEWR
jgi:CHAT domain-containing protein/Tfp pilus assembly protein PilF